MKQNIFNFIILSNLLISNSLSAEFFINVNLNNNTQNIIIDSSYDSFGFDENGVHRSGNMTDSEGFDANGRRIDSNSSINQSLNQSLSNSYTIDLNQDVVEGNFASFSGTIDFSTLPLTISTVEGRTVLLDEGNTINPFPSGIEIIKNGSLENSLGSSQYQNTEEVYEDVQVTYWTEYVRTSTTSSAVADGDGSFSLTQRAATIPQGGIISSRTSGSTRYRYVNNQSSYTNYYTWDSGTSTWLKFRYSADYYVSNRRTRTENRLVSSTTTDYFEINGVNDGDTIDVYIPLRLQVSLDGGIYQDVILTRNNISNQSLSFEINDINVRTASFRITDLNHSTQFSILANINIQSEMLRN